MRPTFFLAGAPKAGTTSLFAWLGAHPGIAVSRVKEPCFFAPEVPVDAATAPHRASWDAYLALFAHAAAGQAVGEGSVAYFASTVAPGAIAARIPGARIIVVLRDPADRLFAHYSAARLAGATAAPFAAWVDIELAREARRQPVWGPVWAGRYATHLARWRASFPDAQILTVFHDELATRPGAVLAGVFAFLGVDASVTVDTTRRHNVSMAPRWAWLSRVLPKGAHRRLGRWAHREARLTPSPSDRAHAIALYRQEIAALEPLVDRSLAGWTS